MTQSMEVDTAYDFRSAITVEYIKGSASDDDVAFAARVSVKGASHAEETAGRRSLIKFLMDNRHGSPFEHNSMTWFVQAPIFVFREFHRHRIASYNEESARYRQMRPIFYHPAPDRNLRQEGKPGAYVYSPGTPEQIELVENEIKLASLQAYSAYERMLEAGIAREVARMVLPVNLFSSMYVTMNARALMNFLSLRTKSDVAKFPSFPMREIEMVAQKMEETWVDLMPETWAAFMQSGRVAP